MISPRVQYAYECLLRLVDGQPVGMPLPPVAELMERLSVSQLTIQRAYDLLQQRGVIQRRRRKGVFVSDRTAVGELAIVVRPQLLSPDASPYRSIASMAIIDGVHEHGSRLAVKMHVGKRTREGADYPATLDLADPGVLSNLRGVFTFHPLYELDEKLKQAGIPVVSLSESFRKYVVSFKLGKDFLATALHHLGEVGCSSVGLILHSRKGTLRTERLDPDVAEMCRSAGLECHPRWIPFRTGDVAERHGYELFKELWRQEDRPDGVIVADEILCRGVFRAILQLGLSLPKDLRLISHATPEVELPYHVPVTRIEFDPIEQADKAVEMMLTLVRGEEPAKKKVFLPGRLVKGSTTY